MSPTATLGLHLATRDRNEKEPARFRCYERVVEAFERGALKVADPIRVGDVTTTLGKYLVAQCLPPEMQPGVLGRTWDAALVSRALDEAARELHVEIAARCAEALEVLGQYLVARTGFSLAMSDFASRTSHADIFAKADEDLARVHEAYQEGVITEGERYNRVLDSWALARDRTRGAERAGSRHDDRLRAVAAASAEVPTPESVRAMPPQTWLRNGVSERPILRTLAQGLEPHDMMLACIATRTLRVEQLMRRQTAARFHADLSAVLGPMRIVARDCGTVRGVAVSELDYVDDDDSTPGLAARIEGRVAAREIAGPDDTVLAPAGALLMPELARRIERAGLAHVVVRDVTVCEATDGVCAMCFGLDPDDFTWPCPGDDMGARAADAIAEAAASFVYTYFHIC
ncbi:MAG: hypothetical protein HOW73_19275 [Polyangiaceae bacterium]|nr:hypothetical protein [Polyangiaceae bacterium]